jgi:hypothetical protein
MPFTSGFDKTIRTVFVVLKDAGVGPGIRDILSQPGTSDFRSGYWGEIWAGTASPAVLNGETWLNGVAVDGTKTPRPSTMSVLSVVTTAGVSASRLFTNEIANWFWMGDVAELVVYTEALSDFDRKAVEDSLALKYATHVATAGFRSSARTGGRSRSR